VEGIDCAGKGEVCPRLAKALNALIYKTPPEHMRAEQDRINATANDAEHYEYFTRVVREASQEIATLAVSQSVVIDRYWMTTVVYHRVMGISATIEDMGGIVMPDFTVYLTVSPEVQAKRMLGRGMSPGDKRMDGRQYLIRQVYEEVLATESKAICVDTSNLTPEQIIEIVIAGIPSIHNG
jgi:dTMP kinase